jgi:hypothetical protein
MYGCNIWGGTKILYWQYMEQYIANIHIKIYVMYGKYLGNMQGHKWIEYEAIHKAICMHYMW